MKGLFFSVLLFAGFNYAAEPRHEEKGIRPHPGLRKTILGIALSETLSGIPIPREMVANFNTLTHTIQNQDITDADKGNAILCFYAQATPQLKRAFDGVLVARKLQNFNQLADYCRPLPPMPIPPDRSGA